jgi:serine/threonine protein kinase
LAATSGSNTDSVPDSEADALYSAIEDISGLLGTSANLSSNNPVSMNSITGGVGTAFYMAPEQQLGNVSRTKSSYSSKADIYSLGVLLFEMFMLKVSNFRCFFSCDG